MSTNNRSSKARNIAKTYGYEALKSRQRANVPNLDNLGGFMLLGCFDLCAIGAVVAGERFDMSPDDVIAFCAGSK